MSDTPGATQTAGFTEYNFEKYDCKVDKIVEVALSVLGVLSGFASFMQKQKGRRAHHRESNSDGAVIRLGWSMLFSIEHCAVCSGLGGGGSASGPTRRGASPHAATTGSGRGAGHSRQHGAKPCPGIAARAFPSPRQDTAFLGACGRWGCCLQLLWCGIACCASESADSGEGLPWASAQGDRVRTPCVGAAVLRCKRACPIGAAGQQVRWRDAPAAHAAAAPGHRAAGQLRR